MAAVSFVKGKKSCLTGVHDNAVAARSVRRYQKAENVRQSEATHAIGGDTTPATAAAAVSTVDADAESAADGQAIHFAADAGRCFDDKRSNHLLTRTDPAAISTTSISDSANAHEFVSTAAAAAALC